MPIDADILDGLIVEPGHDANLNRRHTGWRRRLFGDMPPHEAKEIAHAR
jgi:hypothetical protein